MQVESVWERSEILVFRSGHCKAEILHTQTRTHTLTLNQMPHMRINPPPSYKQRKSPKLIHSLRRL